MSFDVSNFACQLVPLPPDSKGAATPLFLVACGNLDCRSELFRSPTFPLLHNYVTDERPSISTYTAGDKRLKLVSGPPKRDPKFSDMSMLFGYPFQIDPRHLSHVLLNFIQVVVVSNHTVGSSCLCLLVFGVLSTLSAQLLTGLHSGSRFAHFFSWFFRTITNSGFTLHRQHLSSKPSNLTKVTLLPPYTT